MEPWMHNAKLVCPKLIHSAVIVIAFLLVCDRAFAADVKLLTTTIDCWSGSACAIPGYPEWDYAEFANSGGFRTSCTFRDPLPAGSSIVGITGFGWRDFCLPNVTDHGKTTLSLDLNGETFSGSNPINSGRCDCHAWLSSFYDLRPQRYKYGEENIMGVTGLGDGGVGTVRLAHIDLEIAYTDSQELKLEARNLSNLGVLETKALTVQGAAARIPLGATFSLRLTNPGTLPNGVIAEWSRSDNAPAAGIVGNALFVNHTIVEYDESGPPSEVKHFFAAHLGREKITMTPKDPKLPARSVTVDVYAPQTLGDAPHEITDGINRYDLDAEIVKWSHARGVPPQAVKAIMYNEASPAFNVKTWRYEPLSTDWEEFSPNGANKRGLARFASFRMEYDTTHDRGLALIDSEDVHPRSIFYRDRSTRAPISDGDRMVSAYLLYQNNDWWQNWLKYVSAAKRAVILQDPQAALDWSAQTTLAASYGLMQVLYEESYTYGWAGIAGVRRPYYLFDMPANVPDGGSIQTGTAVLAAKFTMANASVDFVNSDEFDVALQRALSCYNSCNLKRAPITAYGRKAFGNIGRCMPSADVSIFN
jgi:hypothetical protein